MLKVPFCKALAWSHLFGNENDTTGNTVSADCVAGSRNFNWKPCLHFVARLSVTPDAVRHERNAVGRPKRRERLASCLDSSIRKRCIGWNDCIKRIAAVVRPLRAIDNRTALHGEPSIVRIDLVMGLDAPDGHVHRNFNDIAAPPFALSCTFSNTSRIRKLHVFKHFTY